MKRLELSVKIEVPESLFEAASVVSKIKAPWDELLSAFELSGLKFEHHEGQSAAPVKRGRKLRQYPPVQPPWPPEAA